MKLIVCLGNPGETYHQTRHNAGFMFADKLSEELGGSFSLEAKFKSAISKCLYKNQALWIVKPLTFMNLSGESLAALKNFYKLDLKDLFLVFDDISLDLGKIRFKSKGSDGGHNGVKSIILHSHTQVFDRLKIGIGPQPPFMKSENFVLQKFSNEELKLMSNTLEKSVEAFFYYCDNNINSAQNKYN